MSEDFTKDEIMRLTAIDRALGTTGPGARPEDVLAAASLYLAFLTTTDANTPF